MTSQQPAQPNSRVKGVYRFLGGAALGAFVAIIPISYSTTIDLNLLQIGIVCFSVVLCGTLTSLWGEKFVNAVTRVLDSFGA